LSFLFLTISLSAHLVCMNIASAGPLACIWLDWRERAGDAAAGRAGRTLAATSLVLFVVGMLLGVLVAWLAWSPAFWRDLIERLPGRLYWGAWELAFSAVLMAAYWGWWRWAPGGAGARTGRTVIALLSATNLLYHFPPLFILIAKLSTGDAAVGESLDDSTFREMMWRGEVVALTVHYWLASLAVAGVLLAVLALRMAPKQDSPEAIMRLAVWGGRLALVPTLLQIPVGLWIVIALPPVPQNRVLGGDLAATTLLGTGVVAALALLHYLASLSIGEATRKTIVGAAVLMLIVIATMTATLRYTH
jgi:hypothetical protein